MYTYIYIYICIYRGFQELLKSKLLRIVKRMSARFTEMKSMVHSRAFHQMAATAAARSIEAFSAQLRAAKALPDGNLTSGLHSIAGGVEQLHALVSAASTHEKLTAAQSVADRAGEYVTAMMRVMRSKAHTLGLYKRTSVESKQRQHWLRNSHASLEDVMQELREGSLMMAMDSMDKTWWQLRAQFDQYFDAMDEHWAGFKTALVALDGYTGRRLPCFCLLLFLVSLRASVHCSRCSRCSTAVAPGP